MEVPNDVQEFLLRVALESRRTAKPFVERTGGARCVYCFAVADQRDHLLPSTAVGPLVHERLVPTVPVCEKCNLHLSTLVEPRIDHRCRYLWRRRGDTYPEEERRRALEAGGASQFQDGVGLDHVDRLFPEDALPMVAADRPEVG